MTKHFAFLFKTELSLEQIFARLNEAGPWRWSMRDNERWGDYISTRALRDPDDAMVKIIVEPDHYVVNTTFESDLPDATTRLEALRATLLEKVLPAIDARDLKPTDTHD